MDHLENSTTSTPDPEPIPPNAEPTDKHPTHTVAPPPKKRKPLSTDALEKLKVARVKAAEANRRKKQERQAAMQATYDPVVVVEQSDSDEQLEGPPNVIFVRRKRAKPQPEKTAEQMQADRLYQRMFGI